MDSKNNGRWEKPIQVKYTHWPPILKKEHVKCTKSFFTCVQILSMLENGEERLMQKTDVVGISRAQRWAGGMVCFSTFSCCFRSRTKQVPMGCFPCTSSRPCPATGGLFLHTPFWVQNRCSNISSSLQLVQISGLLKPLCYGMRSYPYLLSLSPFFNAVVYVSPVILPRGFLLFLLYPNFYPGL